ncbi:hypothetical protein D9M73_243750 [compost metagenome]
MTQPFGGNYRRLPPDTQAAFARHAFSVLLTSHQVHIWRDRHQVAQPFTKQLRFETVAGRAKHVCQGAAVMITRLLAKQ